MSGTFDLEHSAQSRMEDLRFDPDDFDIVGIVEMLATYLPSDAGWGDVEGMDQRTFISIVERNEW